MNRSTFRGTAVVALLTLAAALTLHAQSVPVTNASFENPAVPPGGVSNGIPGWGSFQPNNFTTTCAQPPTFGGVAHPPATAVTPQSDGSQLGLISLTVCPDVFPPTNLSVLTVYQQTGAVWTAGGTTTLTIDFYYPAGGGPTPDHVVIAFPRNAGGPSNCPAAGLWNPFDFSQQGCFLTRQTITPGTNTIQYTPHLGDPVIGKPIVIVIAAVMFGAPGTSTRTAQVYFDNVRLDETAPTRHSSGIVGMYAHQPGVTGHLSTYCDGSVTPAPCDVTLEFHDIHGVLLSQKQLTLHPGTSGFLDYTPPADAQRGPMEIVPIWFLKGGNITTSFALIDPENLRTRLFSNWGDGSVSKMGNLHSGPVAFSRGESVRVKVFCDGSVRTADGSVRPACDGSARFTDSTGRILKQSRLMLAPGTGGFVDLQYEDAGSTERMVEVIPSVNVTGGKAVANFALLDRSSGDTITQSTPASLAAVGAAGIEH